MVKWCPKIALILAIPLLIATVFLACAAPPVITDYKEIECDDCVFMAWTTDQETMCSIQYCYDGKCYWTGDSEWGKLHSIIMPDYYSLTIRAIDREGNETTKRVR